MTNFQEISTILDTNQYLYLNSNNELKCLSLGKRIWRWIQKKIFGNNNAFNDCNMEVIASRLCAAWNSLNQPDQNSFNEIQSIFKKFIKKARSAERREKISTLFKTILPEENKKTLTRKLAFIKYAKALAKERCRTSNLSMQKKYQKATSFLSEWEKSLRFGFNIPISFGFHATSQRNLSAILESGIIKQAPALMGLGAYFSTSDEGGPSGSSLGFGRENYGAFTIALDFSAVEAFSGTQINPVDLKYLNYGEKNHNFIKNFPRSSDRQWYSIHQDIFLRSKIASVIYEDKQGKEILTRMKDLEILTDVPFMSRRIGYLIRDLFVETTELLRPNEERQGGVIISPNWKPKSSNNGSASFFQLFTKLM